MLRNGQKKLTSAYGNRVDVSLVCLVPPGQAPSHLPSQGQEQCLQCRGTKGSSSCMGASLGAVGWAPTPTPQQLVTLL